MHTPKTPTQRGFSGFQDSLAGPHNRQIEGSSPSRPTIYSHIIQELT